MKRNAKMPPFVLFAVSSLVLALLALLNVPLHAQLQEPNSGKPPVAPSSAPGGQPSAAKPPAGAPSTGGTVWVNTDTGAYHKQGSRWYGKTKHGKYMLEADAVQAGYKPAKNK